MNSRNWFSGGRRIGCAVVLFLCTSSVHAQQWATDMFEKTNHDFGVVARGSDARYRLNFTNKYQQAVHVARVQTSCGCTAAKPSKDTLQSRETAYIEITMDTKKFTHEKDSSVTVVFDAPQHAEVRIPIKAYIRTDVVLTPGGVEFGGVVKGSDTERKVNISYAGRENWQIRNVVCKNPHLTAAVTETSRGGGRVTYDLLVTLKSTASIGDVRELIFLVTDDAGNPYVPVMVEGKVEAEYIINPDVVTFGTLAPGEKKTVNVVVRGRKPFAIEKIESEKTAGTFEVRLPMEPRPIHILPLTVIAPKEPGMLDEQFTITIAGTSEPVVFKALGKVSGAAPATAN